MSAEEMRKAIGAAVSTFAPEKKKASDALNEVDRLKGKIPDLKNRISENEQEISELRAEISQGVADGKSMSKEIEKSSTLRGQNEVLQDLVSDLQDEQIPAAEHEAREALDVYQGRISQAIQAVKKDQKSRFSELVKVMAQDILAWNEALSAFSKENGPLMSGNKFDARTMLRFPNISADDNPQRVLVLVERGEI